MEGRGKWWWSQRQVALQSPRRDGGREGDRERQFSLLVSTSLLGLDISPLFGQLPGKENLSWESSSAIVLLWEL